MRHIRPIAAVQSIDALFSENKIDRIENRLANIERLLRNGASTSSSPADVDQTPSSLDSQGGARKKKREIITAEYLDDESAAATPFAGFSSMQAETLAAKDALEQTVGNSPSITQDRQLNEALSSLRSIVGRVKGENNGPAAAAAPSPAASTSDEAAIPPWEQARVLLERAKREYCGSLNTSKSLILLQRIHRPYFLCVYHAHPSRPGCRKSRICTSVVVMYRWLISSSFSLVVFA